ncbi:hypothetical protein [Psychroflexus halocasei]|uniref:Uncharacterized protein n=1 Tax=Psychroflexus halocasei TaxID=908615 RepID=A0A1H4DXI4_9FLAO|nr:hypothetical protein [Psychroflexus halocasei]SEA77070.1 hypothetical protein SAMN05421540_1172 [Psychroflexus halocasei]
MKASNTLSPQWSHDLFNENVFSVTTYQQQLADYIFENHDWGNENFDFINEAQNIFDADWKLQVSDAVSWIGLELTSEYLNYVSQINNPAKQQYILDFRNKINDAKNNCQ